MKIFLRNNQNLQKKKGFLIGVYFGLKKSLWWKVSNFLISNSRNVRNSNLFVTLCWLINSAESIHWWVIVPVPWSSRKRKLPAITFSFAGSRYSQNFFVIALGRGSYELTKLIYGNCTAQLDLCTADLLSATGRCNSYRVEHTARLRGVWERVTSDLLVCKIYAILNSCSQSVADGRRDHRTRLFVVQFPRAFNPRARSI